MYETKIEFESEKTPEKRIWIVETKMKIKIGTTLVVGHRRGLGVCISSVKKEK